MKIEDLGLSPRTANALGRAGIREVEQLRDLTEKDLLMLRGIGVACLKELKACIDIAQKEDGTRRAAKGSYADGYIDGRSEAIREAAERLRTMSGDCLGAQSASFQVAARVIEKMGSSSGTYMEYEGKEDSGLLSED